MKDRADDFLLAYCGLVCSDCGMYKKGKCDGCNSDAPLNKNCKVKACAVEHEYSTCADCEMYAEFKDCGKLNNFVSKVLGFIFRTNRIVNLDIIKRDGVDALKEKFQKEEVTTKKSD